MVIEAIYTTQYKRPDCFLFDFYLTTLTPYLAKARTRQSFMYNKNGGSSLRFSFFSALLSGTKPQYANVSLQCTDVCLHGTDVSLHGTDVSLHGTDVSLHGADVSLQCKNTNILYANDKECIKNILNENYIIKRKFNKHKGTIFRELYYENS